MLESLHFLALVNSAVVNIFNVLCLFIVNEIMVPYMINKHLYLSSVTSLLC